MEDLIKEFNECFEGDAKIEIVDSEIRITIGSRTLFVSLPEIVGGCSTGSSPSV